MTEPSGKKEGRLLSFPTLSFRSLAHLFRPITHPLSGQQAKCFSVYYKTRRQLENSLSLHYVFDDLKGEMMPMEAVSTQSLPMVRGPVLGILDKIPRPKTKFCTHGEFC